jgi:hypothetical protein
MGGASLQIAFELTSAEIDPTRTSRRVAGLAKFIHNVCEPRLHEHVSNAVQSIHDQLYELYLV